MKILIRLGFTIALLPSSVVWAQYLPERPSREDAIQAQRQQEAAQPGNNAPVWRDVQSGVPNSTSVQGRETEVLIQPPSRFPGQENISTAGEAWQNPRQTVSASDTSPSVLQVPSSRPRPWRSSSTWASPVAAKHAVPVQTRT